MTNQEWLCSLSAEDFLGSIKWLLQNYGKRWTDSDPAIIEWLQGEHEVNTPEDKEMTNDEAIEIMCAYGVPQDEDKFREALNMAIRALKQNEELRNMVKMGIAKDCESCKAHRIDVLDKIRAEVGKAWYTHPKNRYQEGLKDQALKDVKIIDKYKAESEDE